MSEQATAEAQVQRARAWLIEQGIPTSGKVQKLARLLDEREREALERAARLIDGMDWRDAHKMGDAIRALMPGGGQ
jgi:hypothetical protein